MSWYAGTTYVSDIDKAGAYYRFLSASLRVLFPEYRIDISFQYVTKRWAIDLYKSG